jgi:hypothetical protein
MFGAKRKNYGSTAATAAAEVEKPPPEAESLRFLKDGKLVPLVLHVFTGATTTHNGVDWPVIYCGCGLECEFEDRGAYAGFKCPEGDCPCSTIMSAANMGKLLKRMLNVVKSNRHYMRVYICPFSKEPMFGFTLYGASADMSFRLKCSQAGPYHNCPPVSSHDVFKELTNEQCLTPTDTQGKFDLKYVLALKEKALYRTLYELGSPSRQDHVSLAEVVAPPEKVKPVRKIAPKRAAAAAKKVAAAPVVEEGDVEHPADDVYPTEEENAE